MECEREWERGKWTCWLQSKGVVRGRGGAREDLAPPVCHTTHLEWVTLAPEVGDSYIWSGLLSLLDLVTVSPGVGDSHVWSGYCHYSRWLLSLLELMNVTPRVCDSYVWSGLLPLLELVIVDTRVAYCHP
jgi:hypothetical protein